MGCGSIQKIHEPIKTSLSNRKPDQDGQNKALSQGNISTVEKRISKIHSMYIDTQENVEVPIKVIDVKPYVYVPYLHIEKNALYQKRVM